MAKKNVLIFFGEKRSSGGIETYVNLLTQSLSQDYNLHNIFFTKDKNLFDKPPQNSYPLLIEKNETVDSKKTLNDFYDKAFDLDEKIEFDLIHINSTNIFAGCLLAKKGKEWGIPIITTNHYWKETKEKHLLKREENSKNTFLFSDRIICVSQASADELDYISEDKKVVIHPGIDTNFFKPMKTSKQERNDNLFSIICPATYNELKNQIDLVKFSDNFKEECPNFKINFYGSINTSVSKKYFKELELNISNSKKDRYFSVNRDVNINQMPQLLSENDLLISTSLYESFGQIFTEAQACGIPVIGYNIGGIPETMQDKRTGFLVEPGNIGELVKYAKLFYKSRSLLDEFGTRGREFIKENFCSKKQADKYSEEYKRILE